MIKYLVLCKKSVEFEEEGIKTRNLSTYSLKKDKSKSLKLLYGELIDEERII